MKFEWRKMLSSCVGMIVFACLLNLFLVDGRVNAGVGVSQTKCSDVMDGKVFNPSLAEACSKWYNNPLDWGALWISNMKKEKEDGSYNKDYLASKVTMDNGAIVSGNKLTVYLRGAVIGSSGGRAECIDIKIKNGKNTYTPFTFAEKNHENGMCTITNVDNGPNYGKTRKLTNYWVDRIANGSPKTSNIKFEGTTMSLDLASIKDWASVASRRGGHIDYNNVNVTIFRCFEGTRTETDHCYDNNSVLGIDLDLIKANASVQLVSDSTKSASTGETIDTSKQVATLMLDDCEFGCQVKFRHTIEKTLGTLAGQKIFYNIKDSINRVDNTWTDVKNLVAGVKNTFTENNVDVGKVVTLFPGEVLCRRMNFGLASGSSAVPPEKDLRYVTVCAAAKGTLRTSVNLSVSKEQGGASIVQPNENENIYLVQPGKFKITTSYISNVQKAMQMRFNKVELGNILFSQDSWWDGARTLEGIMNSNGMEWKNELRLSTGRNWNYTREYQTFPAGSYCGTLRDTLTRGSLGRNWTCTKNDVSEFFDEVGKEYTVSAKTNAVSGAKTVPTQINFARQNYDGKSYFRAKISYDPVVSSLKIRVPYNFRNSTWLKEMNEMNESESGKKYEVRYLVEVGERNNETLGAKYSTKVDNAMSGVYWCKIKKGISVSSVIDPEDACDGVKETVTYDADRDREGIQSETLFPGQNPHERPVEIDLEEQKVEVGDTICVWSWVTPGRSGNDKSYDARMDSNWGDNNIAYSWGRDGTLESKRLCKSIGKKPTIQVWGGNVFSEGPLNVSSPFLREFDQGEGKESEKRYYGSFGELGVFVSNDNAGNFASGAALGYSGFEEGSPWPRPSPIPNRDGVYVETVRNDGWFGGSTRQDDYGELRVYSYDDKNDKYIEYAKELVNGLCNGKSDDAVGSKVECFNNPAEIHGETIAEGRVIYMLDKGDVRIEGDLLYDKNVTTYSSLSDIPKFIIVAADGDININCDVTEIDALLVAGGTVNTCKDESTNNNRHDDKKYFNQLTIYGAVIANKLIANRAFGAGPGVYSIVPAEIIKFDPSLYDLGIGSAGSEPRIVDVTELAPRY